MAIPEEDPQVVADAKSQEVIESARTHAEAVEEARKRQLEAAIISSRGETLDIFTRAMREVLSTGEEGTKVLLLQKIPLLCADILVIKADMRWIKWFVTGIAGGIGAIVLAILIMKSNGG